MRKARELWRVLLSQRRPRMILVITALLYLLVYLYAIGDINVRGMYGLSDAYLVSDPLSTMLERRAALYFEAIAVVSLPYLTWLVAPINILIGALLGLLVGINMALSDLAWRQSAQAAVCSLLWPAQLDARPLCDWCNVVDSCILFFCNDRPRSL